MSQINTIPQPHIGGAQLQSVNGADQRSVQSPPAGLGSQHSIGKTIGRVLVAIATVGISEFVRFIIR